MVCSESWNRQVRAAQQGKALRQYCLFFEEGHNKIKVFEEMNHATSHKLSL
jgi:hypothetical protein